MIIKDFCLTIYQLQITHTHIEDVLDGVEFKNVATFLWHDKHKLHYQCWQSNNSPSRRYFYHN